MNGNEQTFPELTPEVIAELKKKYTQRLYRIDFPGGETFVVRGSNWTEFETIMGVSEKRLPVELVRNLVVFPEVDATDLSTNASGRWEPGKLLALSEQIQKVLGYAQPSAVKNL